jgi:hypothetical protein
MKEMEQTNEILKKKKKKKESSRSIETMFRTTLSNHIQLSNMADRKAGLMVSVNSIIISIMVSFLVHEFANNPKLIGPTALLVLICLLVITFAILATKPSISTTPAKKIADMDLLFFGDYTSLSLDNYKMAMKDLVNNEANLQEQLVSNIYAQGIVLKYKYKLLKIAYLIFMIGFPVVMLSYLIVIFGLF